MKTIFAFVLLAGLGLLSGCSQQSVSTAPPGFTTPPSAGSAADQPQTADLPDPRMTPGATLPVTKEDICVPGYAHKVRNVPQDVKNQAYAEYGITHHAPGEYEVDHLISLELGGSNSLKNLWPQSYKTHPWNAHVKDALENELHAEVCSGQIDLPTAQHEIATNWIAAYKKHFHTNGPLSGTRSPRRETGSTAPDSAAPEAPAPEAASPGSAADAPNGQVWVNLNSGKYFHPGAKYYGTTKHGQYMSESEAQKQGFVAARGQ